MANNVLWGHIGSCISAVLAGAAAYWFYPNIKYCFCVIAFSAVAAVSFVPFLPEGDPLMGRGFHGKKESDITSDKDEGHSAQRDIQAASYLSVMSETKTLILCLTGFFFQ